MDAKHAAFIKWLESAGGFVHPQLDLFAELGNRDRGVVAQQAITQGDALLVVPRHLCMYVSQPTPSGNDALVRGRCVRGLPCLPMPAQRNNAHMHATHACCHAAGSQ